MFRLESQEILFAHAQDPAAVERTAEFLAQLVDGRLAGFGITSDLQDADLDRLTQEEVHLTHCDLLFSAARTLEPHINPLKNLVGKQRGVIYPPSGPDEHVDVRQRDAHNPTELIMDVRLHTADSENGAEVSLALSEPGLFYPSGEVGGINGRKEDIVPVAKLLEGGYDLMLFPQHATRSYQRPEITYSPTLLQEKTVISGFQAPLTSIVFISHAAWGPITAHTFHNEDEKRTIMTSDMRLRSISELAG